MDNKRTQWAHTFTKVYYSEQMGKSVIFDNFLYPDQSQNLIGSKLDPDPSSHFVCEDSANSICLILLTNKQTNEETMNLIPPWQR